VGTESQLGRPDPSGARFEWRPRKGHLVDVREQLKGQALYDSRRALSSPKNPWRGLGKADAWLELKGAALNLDRIGRLGQTGSCRPSCLYVPMTITRPASQ
jgi:hypothetical protein